MEENSSTTTSNIPSAISIRDARQTEVLRIETNGTMMWRPQGSTELMPLDVDKDLALAFSLCVEMMSGVSSGLLMDNVRKNAVLDKSEAIANKVADYMVEVKLIQEDHRPIHFKNIMNIARWTVE